MAANLRGGEEVDPSREREGWASWDAAVVTWCDGRWTAAMLRAGDEVGMASGASGCDEIAAMGVVDCRRFVGRCRFRWFVRRGARGARGTGDVAASIVVAGFGVRGGELGDVVACEWGVPVIGQFAVLRLQSLQSRDAVEHCESVVLIGWALLSSHRSASVDLVCSSSGCKGADVAAAGCGGVRVMGFVLVTRGAAVWLCVDVAACR